LHRWRLQQGNGGDCPRRKKLLTWRRPVRNWTRRTISSLFLCSKLHLFLGKSTKKLPPTDLFFLTPRGSRRLCPVISFEQFKHWPRGTHGIFVVERCRYVLRFRGATAVPISRPCDREPNPPVTRPTRDVLRYRFAAKSKTGANK